MTALTAIPFNTLDNVTVSVVKLDINFPECLLVKKDVSDLRIFSPSKICIFLITEHAILIVLILYNYLFQCFKSHVLQSDSLG